MSSSDQSSNTTNESVALEAILSSADFTIARYLNEALRIPTSKEKEGNDDDYEDVIQGKTAELALRLHVQTQSCHDEIGRIGAELRAVLPRCDADVRRVGNGLDELGDNSHRLLLSVVNGDNTEAKMEADDASKQLLDDENNNQDLEDDTSVTASVASLTESNAPSAGAGGGSLAMSPLEALSTLHALRSNLALTRTILSAASTWDRTVSSVPALLEKGDVSAAASALSNLESGERALRGMPGGTDRSASIAKIRSDVEAMLKPRLLHALGGGDVAAAGVPVVDDTSASGGDARLGPLRECAAVYATLGRMDALVDEYVRRRPAAVQRKWFDFALPASTVSATETAQHNDGPADTKANAATAFITWLPEWYEMVLALLSDERRRAVLIFGVDLAPEIVSRVLGECFRPILSSFKTRLSTIFPPDTSTSSALSTGSLDSICAAYQSTLQFLSLAYDQMVNFDASSTLQQSQHFLLESTTTATNNEMSGQKKSPLQLYISIKRVFTTVASPFAAYQQRFASMELAHSGSTAKMVARDIQGAVSHNQKWMTIPALQDAVEKLTGLAPFLFPLMDATVARFELLNGGYNLEAALSTIDTILSEHAGELGIAISTLSATVTSDEDRLANDFDDQHVQTALEVLRVAGTFRRQLTQFQRKTRHRFGALYGRMRAAAVEDNGGKETSKISNETFSVPDSLSAVEIGSMLARAVCGEGESMDTKDDAGRPTTKSLATLQRLSGSISEWDQTSSSSQLPLLFGNALDSSSRLAKNCHSFVYDVCSAVPRRSLSSMSTLPAWTEDDGSGGIEESYGILPQSYVTQVGEHMLSLVQALEPFASDPEVLSLANEVMGMEIRKNISVQPWKEFAAASGYVEGNRDDAGLILLDAANLSDLLVGTVYEDEDEDNDDDDAEKEDESAKATTAFCNQWLDVVGSAVTGRLLERMLRIPRLSRKGQEHLSVDLNYLTNVFSALGVSGHPHPLLSHFASLATMDPEELRALVASRDDVVMKKTGAAAGIPALKAAETRLGLMRGIAL